MGDSFHFLSGVFSRESKRRSYSSRVTENQYLKRRTPERVIMRSTSGHWRMNSR